MKVLQVLGAALLGSGLLAGAAQAAPVFDEFGPLPQATFNPTHVDSGIPNENVAITDVDFAGIGFTLGLTAHQRFDNPALTNDGLGTFFAQPGSNDPNGTGEGALWNFGFYAEIKGGPDAGDLFDGEFAHVSISLLYDVDPGVGTDFGVIDLVMAAVVLGGASETVLEDSQNLLFAVLAGTPALPFIAPPSGTFNPNALGIYTFVLQVTNPDSVIMQTSIDVIVNADDGVAPEPATLGLVGAALLGFAALRRRAS